MNIAAWLRELGLERYEQAFRENEIDAAILPKLTSDDLREIGVAAIGHRRRLLEAIAALTDEPRRAPPPGQGAPIEAAVAARPTEAERRQLTVLFCDVVGSTELSARLDPEELREVMGAYHRCAAAVIERFEGHVAKYLGDGVLAYLGWPRAHEDDAERAVRAGLELVEAVAALAPLPGAQLRARVGIATGMAVVGDLMGEGASREEAVVGDVPNLAARLQALAEPRAVVIGDATRRLIGRLFELDDLGPQRLKGFSEPLAVWRVVGESRAEGRFEARQAAGLTPLVGRDEELSLLLRRWRQAADGEGQVVLLSGEPGIGKSRLVRELRSQLESAPHLRLTYQCSPHHQASPLRPVIEQLERAAGLERGDPPEAKLDKLETLLARGTEKVDEAVPLIAALLGLPAGNRYALPELTPQRQKQLSLSALVDQLDGLSAEQPVLLIYEDVHWIDPTTQELLGLAIERTQRLPVLLLITFRPEFNPPWAALPHVSSLALTRLGRRDGAAMVELLAGAKALPAEISAQIAGKTDGVPLFVEELTKAVLESGLLRDEGDRWELSGPLPPLAIPSTLQDSLLARLDRLAPVKEVAQIGAAIGRDFSHALLAAVADRPEPALHDALDQLVSSELVFRRGTPPEATYSFKHALVQDAAYQSLLKTKRRQLHAQIAKALEERIPNAAGTQPEVLAHHFSEAGLAKPAVDYWLQAGELAIRRSATAEAIAQLKTGLKLVESLPRDRERTSLELDLQVALGGALLAARGFAAPETGEAYSQARELCRQLGQPPQLFRVLFGQFAFHLVRAELGRSLAIAKELLRAAQDQHETAPLVIGHRAVGIALFHRGELGPARLHLEQACAFYDAPQHRSLAFLYVFDPFVASASFLSCSLFALGHPERARVQSDAALGRARELGHPGSVAFALFFACLLAQFAGNRRAVQEQAQELLALASEQGFAFWAAQAMILEGWSLAVGGWASEVVPRIRQGINDLCATGAAVYVPHFLALLAQAQQCEGQVARAEDTLVEALEWARRTGEQYYEAELLRHRGELLLARPAPDPRTAERCLVEALETARRQRTKTWELRAAVFLARLWRDQGKRIQARDLLAPVYGWFTEGFDTPDLKDAGRLLEELT